MGFMTKFMRYFDLDDDSPLPEDQTIYDKAPAGRKKQKVVSLQSVQQPSRVVLIEPESFDDAQKIADELKNHRAAVMNFQRVSRGEAERIIDFLSGTVYAIEGDFQKLGPHTFICTPENIDVSGAISEMADRVDR
ncbi:MAG TPA: cell division protein SepF [Bacillales bacterium]|nr:cell division protein SepF [Bacillales bacterium]